MFRTIRAIAIAAGLSAFALGAHAAPGRPLTDADKAEAQGLLDNYAMPIINDMNVAVSLARTDTPKACDLIHTVEQRAMDLDHRAKALHARLLAEGKTTDGLDQLVKGTGEMIDGTHTTATGICSGAMARSGDPETDAAIDKLASLTARFTGSINAYNEAEKNNDHIAACSHLRDANAAYRELYAFIIDARSKIPDGTPDAAQADALIAKLNTYEKTLSLLKTCPAT